MGRPTLAVVGVGSVVIAALLSLAIGSRAVPPAEIWSALVHPDSANPLTAVVRERIPRTILGLLVGAALAVAGAGMQGVTRNPLADPGLLGINAGAATAVVVGIHWFSLSSPVGFVCVALLGATAAMVGVHAIAAGSRSGATPLTLVLAGAGITAALTSLLTAILVGSRDTLDTFRFWQVGSVAGRSDSAVEVAVPFLVVGALLVLTSGGAMNALAVGDDLARGLGGHPGLDRARVGLGVVLLCGAATSVAGPIGFVGLMVPHGVRMLGLADHRRLLPMCAAIGGALLVVADTLGRVIAPPAELQVGIMTALIGVPVFILVVRRGRQVAL